MRRFGIVGLFALGVTFIEATGALAQEWTFNSSLDFVYLNRGDVEGGLIEYTATGEPVLSGSDFDLGWAPGVDAQARVHNDRWGAGVRYLGGFNWDDRIAVPITDFAIFLTEPALSVIPADFSASYGSRLDSFEFNGMWMPSSRVTVLGGLRWVGIDDSLLVRGTSSVAVLDFNLSLESRGLGPQIGAEFRVIDPSEGGLPIFLDVDARIGAVYLSHDGAFIVGQPSLAPIFDSAGGASDWSFLGEVGAKIGAKVGERGSVTLGYRGVYLNRVPQAAGQYPGVDVLAGTMELSYDSFWSHGVTVGFEMNF